MSYIAALRYTKEAKGYEGVITWSGFESKEDLDTWISGQKDQEDVDEGITMERAVELTRQTPAKSYLLAALQDATHEDGSIDPLLLKHELEKAYFGITREIVAFA